MNPAHPVYRSLGTVTVADAVGLAAVRLSQWMAERGDTDRGVDLSTSGSYQLSHRSHATVVRHSNSDDIECLRLSTETVKPDGVWHTAVTVAVDPDQDGDAWLWVEMLVEADQPPTADRVYPPQAARVLLDELGATDSGHRLTQEPRIVRGRDDSLVAAFTAAVRDPGRRLAVVATGAPRDVTVAGWREAMAGALARSTGMCAGYVLDAAAIERVGALLPQALDVPAGGIRTFLPGVDLADEADHPRHLRMSPARLGAARTGTRLPWWVGAALSQSVRETALAVPVPDRVREVDALLRALADQIEKSAANTRAVLVYRRDSAPEAAPAPPEPEVYEASIPPAPCPSQDTAGGDLASAHERDAQEQLTQRLREEVKRQSARIAELTEERQALLAETADLSEEVETAREQLRAARFEARWLRERVREEGLFRLAATPAPRDPQQRPPVTVRDLLDRITDGSALPHLFFTIEDHDTVHELEDSRKETLWVTRAWEALLALNDYARYQFDNPGSGLGFHSYLRETPDGYQVIPVKRLASQESDYVRNRGKLNEKRLFRVPTEVEPSGRVPMYAHIKLDIEYGICPRLYFYPHLGPGTTNRVYIGYLGRHLPNARTS